MALDNLQHRALVHIPPTARHMRFLHRAAAGWCTMRIYTFVTDLAGAAKLVGKARGFDGLFQAICQPAEVRLDRGLH